MAREERADRLTYRMNLKEIIFSLTLLLLAGITTALTLSNNSSTKLRQELNHYLDLMI